MNITSSGLTSNRTDPYALWAEATKFEYLTGATPTSIPVIIEARKDLVALSDAIKVGSLKSEVFVSSVFLRLPGAAKRKVCTGRMTPTLIAQANANPSHDLWRHVERFELAMHVNPTTEWRTGEVKNTGVESARTIIGLIDIGCAYANKAWRDRVIGLWHQGAVTNTGNSVPYGVEWLTTPAGSAPEPIRSVTDDVETELASYRTYGFSQAKFRSSHGVAVLCEIANHQTNPSAEKAPIMLVELPTPVLRYSARAALSAHLLDGIAWILDRGAPCLGDETTRFVVNISLGTQAGPHDGSSMLETAFDELITAYTSKSAGERLALVVAAGNSYLAECHAILKVQPRSKTMLHWAIPPDDVTPSYVEIWFPNGANCAVELTSPTGEGITATPGTQLIARSAAGIVSACVVNCQQSAGGDGAMALIAVAPNASGATPHGTWTITLRSERAVDGIHCYVERDNSMFDPARPLGRQSHFVNVLGEANVELAPKGTLNSFATGRKTIVVGSYVHVSGTASVYSSAGPVRNQTYIKPDVCAVGDEALGLRGIPVSGNVSGTVTRASGTSIASPQVAALIAGALQKGFISPNKSVVEWLREKLVSRSSHSTMPNAPPDPQIGGGSISRWGLENGPHQLFTYRDLSSIK
jgi:Subtilase family